jgi:hypothetical protein
MSEPWMESGSTEHMQLQKIRSLLSGGLMAPPPGRNITKLAFTWNPDGSLGSLGVYEGADLLFTLTFTWNPDGSLADVVRS